MSTVKRVALLRPVQPHVEDVAALFNVYDVRHGGSVKRLRR
jgi:hypothetical protein